MRILSMLVTAAVIGFAAGAAAQTDNAELKPENDPNSCSDLWKGIGLPDYAREIDDTVIVCHSRYVLSHNNANKQPDWVIEHLTREQISGTNKRPKMKFQPDPSIPDESARALDKDYANSKFDRGHQAPSDDFKANRDWMVESFFLSNIVPQVGVGFNRGIWKQLEDHVRDVVRSRGELYVVTGPVFPGPDGNGKLTISKTENTCKNKIDLDPPKRAAICGAATKCENGVRVPSALFKIVYDPGTKRANAFILPNINHRDSKDFDDPIEYLRGYQVSVRVVERFTGIEFFRDIPLRQRRPIAEQCAGLFGH